MGGIVTRWWIKLLGGNALVSHYIQAGAPNDGAKITKLYDLMMLGLTHAINLVPIPGVIKGLITALFRFADLDTIDDNIGVLTPGSATLKELARVQAPGIPYTILSADTAKIPKSEKQRLFFLQRMLRNLGYKIAKDLIFKEPNDLVLGVSSSRAIPHPDLVQKTETIACDHFGFFSTAAGSVLLEEVMWKLLDEEQVPV